MDTAVLTAVKVMARGTQTLCTRGLHSNLPFLTPPGVLAQSRAHLAKALGAFLNVCKGATCA